ncbi:uncharacterized protein LOC8258323 isoform X2 [Ricinus communis]|nr:uncharacterized protein LOC8258323 isoform X2 [Ricinus communis]|eukprot:XP_025013873.1 uncharacterized protein LOC8258323 isoform X2 [Ricinus communis]
MAIQIKTNGYTSNSKAHGALNDSSSSEISSSPSTKTPTLVARLMGLDLLPDHQTYSPISSTHETPNPLGKSRSRRRYSLQSKHGSSDFSGTRSLPETPRISSARRSDVEHRLSLQIHKENMSPSEELVFSRISSFKRKELKTEEENRSPGHYARQIVKQVKESVSRKVGLDITNTVRSRDHELVNQLKTKKIMSKVLTRVGDDSSSPGKNSIASASCSPRLKFLEPRNIKQVSPTVMQSTKDHNIISESPKSSIPATPLQVNVMPQKMKAPTKPKLQPVQEQVQQEQQRPIKKCKKVAEERFGPPPRLKKPPQTSDIIRNKQEESFVRQATVTRANIPDKKCKKTPLSNDLLNITVPTLLLPVKKDPTTTPRAAKIPPKQAANHAQESKCSSQLFSCSRQSYKEQEVIHTTLNARGNSSSNNVDRSNGAAAAATTTTTTTTGDKAAEIEEYEYISRILRRTGIDKDTQVSFTRWFSPSHPLDPSIFYYLEYFTTISPSSLTNPNNNIGQLSHRCNRKLLFHLVDEILVDILKPYLNMKPWVERFDFSAAVTIRSHSNFQGSDLVDMLCSKIRSFPGADCRVLDDIDALVDKDMRHLYVQNDVAFGEEGEGIVTELEKDLLDTLIHETAVIFYAGILQNGMALGF